MVEQDEGVVGVDEGALRAGRVGALGPPQVVRVGHDVLVEGAAARHQYGRRRRPTPPSPAGLLPGAGDAAGVAGHNHGVQPANVDAQFQGVGRHDAAHRAVAQTRLDATALGGQVAAPVAADRAVDGLPQLMEDDLGGQARAGEDGGLHVVGEEAAGEQGRLLGRAAPHAERAVHHGRVEADEVARAARRAVLVHHRDGRFDQPLGQLGRVGDGGRAQDELGGRAVEGGDAPQPAQHVGDVAAEDAPVGVHLVQDHQAQPLEELGPLGVVGQDAGVQHVRVGDQHARRPPYPGPRRGGRVAVVGGGAKGRRRTKDRGRTSIIGQFLLVFGLWSLVRQRFLPPPQLRQLVLGQGFRREQVQRAGLGVGGQALEGGQQVAQALARRGGRDNADMLAARRRVQRLGLVGVELSDAPPL